MWLVCKKKKKETKNKNKKGDFHYYVKNIQMYFVKSWQGPFCLNDQNSFWNGQKVN